MVRRSTTWYRDKSSLYTEMHYEQGLNKPDMNYERISISESLLYRRSTIIRIYKSSESYEWGITHKYLTFFDKVHCFCCELLTINAVVVVSKSSNTSIWIKKKKHIRFFFFFSFFFLYPLHSHFTRETYMQRRCIVLLAYHSIIFHFDSN